MKALTKNGCLLLTLVAIGNLEADPPSLLRHLPQKAVGAVEVNDFRRATETYRDSRPGDATDNPFGQLRADFGIRADVLESLASGKAWRIELSYGPTSLRHVLVLEIEDRDRAQRTLDRAAAENGASTRKSSETSEHGEIAMRIEYQDAAGALRTQMRILSEKHLVVAADPGAARDVFAALASGESTEGDRGQADLPGSRPFDRATDDEDVVVSWWVRPSSHLEQLVAKQRATSEEKEAWQDAQRHGLVGIHAFGGSAQFHADGVGTGRAFVLAPHPRASTLQVLNLTPANNAEIPRWLARGVDDMLLLHGNVPAALQQMDRVFDDLLADGIDGTYREILEDVKSPEGLNIDLEKELFPHLGPRVFLIRSTPDAAPPDGESGEKQPQLLLAMETREASSVAATIAKLMKDDIDVSQVHLPSLPADVWRVESSEAKNRPSVTVVHGYTLYATDYSILAEQLAPPGEQHVDKLAAINGHLRQRMTSIRPAPSMIRLRGNDLRVAPESESDEGPRLVNMATPDIRHFVLEMFFLGVSTRLPTTGYASYLRQITEKTADPIVFGFTDDNGWYFVGSSSLDHRGR